MPQIAAPPTLPISDEAFSSARDTALWWLTNAGFLLNSQGALVMIDPAISLVNGVHETGHPLLVDLPLEAHRVPRLDAVLYTHADYDHFAPVTAQELVRTGAFFLGPPPVAQRLLALGVPAARVREAHAYETHVAGPLAITAIPADHPWQSRDPAQFGPPWGPGDCCGYLLTTPDGRLYHPGDTRLMEAHLRLRGVNVLLLDVSRNRYHLGVADAARLANTLGSPHVIPHHYGSYDAPEATPHNPYDGDPAEVAARLERPTRLRALAPGERFAVTCV